MPSTLSTMLLDTPVRRLSLDEFFALYPPEVDDTVLELVEGQVVVVNSPSGPHQRLIFRLGHLLEAACPVGYEPLAGPIDWVLWGDPLPTVRVPDLVVVRSLQADGIRLVDPPLLAVEVLSPDSFERDVVTKRREYARAGLEHYWIARPNTGEIIRYGRAGEELVELGRLPAGKATTVTEPFTVTIDPANLLGPRRPAG